MTARCSHMAGMAKMTSTIISRLSVIWKNNFRLGYSSDNISWRQPFLFLLCICALQVLLSWIICWLLATRHWVQTQHLDHWGCFRNRGERERERWPSQGHLLLDVLKLWNSDRICTSLVSPRTFFFCTHIHTSFPTKPCLNDSYLFWTTKNFYLNNEKQK